MIRLTITLAASIAAFFAVTVVLQLLTNIGLLPPPPASGSLWWAIFWIVALGAAFAAGRVAWRWK